LNFNELKEFNIKIKKESNVINLIHNIKQLINPTFIFYSNKFIYYITKDDQEELMNRLLNTAAQHYVNLFNLENYFRV